MRRMLSIVLVLLMLLGWVSATAGTDPTAFVRSRGYSPEASGDSDGAARCDFTVVNSAKATVDWSDAQGAYAVTGSADALAQLYIDLLAQWQWDSCCYRLKQHASIGYGAQASEVCDTLPDYIARMGQTLGVQPTPDASPDGEEASRSYVLNTNTMKFHIPTCPSVGQIKDHNRETFDGPRSALIAKGYAPCQNCNP